MDFERAVLMAESRYYNEVLNPRFWLNGVFNKDVRTKLLDIVDDFYGNPENSVPIDDIQLTGSLANYNYTTFSDLDVHILLDFSKINDDTTLVKRALDGKRFIWNLRYNIEIRGHQVELYYQDVNEPHIASGLYSLKEDKWLIEPSYNPPSIDERDVLKKSQSITDMINRLGDKVKHTTDSNEAKTWHTYARKLKDKISKMRAAGLKRDGEFAIENLSFKELRNNGAIGKLIKIISTAYSKIYSEKLVVAAEADSLLAFMNKPNTNNTKLNLPNKDKPTNYKQLDHRGITRAKQTWVPDTHRITKDDIVNQKVEKSKEDNISRMLTTSEVLRAASKYGIDINKLRKGERKQLGTSSIEMWFDRGSFFIQGSKKRHA